MENRNALLSSLKKVNDAGRIALCGYLLTGYPSPRLFYETARAAARLDAIEFGIPALNPALDGPVISHAHQVVINHRGMDAETALALIGGLRSMPQPRFVMTYAQDGRALDGFLRSCVENGVQGVFAPDIGQEEAVHVASIARALHLAYVSFIDGSMDREDLQRRLDISDLVYLRASPGVTGQCAVMDERALDGLRAVIGRIRAHKPGALISVGIGIQHPEQVRQLADLDLQMVIIGTRLMEHLERGEQRMIEYIDALHRMSYRSRPAAGHEVVLRRDAAAP